MTIYLDEARVRELLDMPTAIHAVERVLRAHALAEAVDVPRQRTRIAGAMLHMLQGAVPADHVLGFKTYTTTREGARFWVHLFDSASGRPLAVIEADYLGMMRTGAAAAIAARELAAKRAPVAAVIGAGWQARSQIAGLCAVRPIEEVRVFARRRPALEAFCSEMRELVSCRIEPAASAEQAVAGAAIVATITNATDPVLRGEWLAEGCHVNAAGSNALTRRELDAEVFRRAALVCVDSREVALRESGDLLPVLERGRINERSMVELGEILAGQRAGRQGEHDITVFESQGMAVQDLAVAAEVLRRAGERSVGEALPW